ncbi:MAG TPA: hypothetical protein VIM19_03035 [Actinomycetes bacterium]
MLSDQEIASLTPAERADLVRRLQANDRAIGAESAGQRLRTLFLSLVAVACVVLVPWIVLLAVTLPKSYVVHRWTPVWTGFDVALLATLAATAWAAWRRRQLLVVFAVVGATLLACDAWFDVMTASTWSDEWVSVSSALLVELPFAAVLLLVARRLLRLTLQRVHGLSGTVGTLPPLYRIPLLGIDPRSAARGLPAPR